MVTVRGHEMVNIFFAGSALAAIVSIALAVTGYYINSAKSNVSQAFYSDISELSTDSEKQDYLLSLHEENNRLAVSLDEINLEKEEVSSAHDALTANLESLTFEQEESHRQLEAVEQKYNKGLSEIAALQEVISDLNVNKEQLTQSVSALEEENGRISAAMKELSFGKEEISNAHQDITSERDEFQRQLGLMKKSIMTVLPKSQHSKKHF
jgi:chromosome segregation ATPase